MKHVEVIEEQTGFFWWTEGKATKFANSQTKMLGEYFTAIKGDPLCPDRPDECWAITNKFDPRLISNH